MITTKQQLTLVEANISEDINAEIKAKVEQAIKECIAEESKTYLRNITVEFKVAVI